MDTLAERFYAWPTGAPEAWVPRLVAPDALRAGVMEPGWRLLTLPLPLLHPAHHRGAAPAIATLLGLDASQLRRAATGLHEPEERGFLVVEPPAWPARLVSEDERDALPGGVVLGSGPTAVHALLRCLDPVAPPPQASPEARALLAAFASAGAHPAWLAPSLIPVPVARASLEGCLADLARLSTRLARLVALAAPQVVIESDSVLLQRRFDELYDALAPR